MLGDGRHVVHLFERESLQRRRQKILEEAPSPSLTPAARRARRPRASRKKSAIAARARLEYLFDDARGEFYFIEMNTRIQVEHPVTEAITGIDLVRETLRIADGEPLRFAQHDITMSGAALECRINAEDPLQDFRPNPGRIDELVWPTGPGVRIDSLLYPGLRRAAVLRFAAREADRTTSTRGCARMTRALGELHVGGLKTTAPLHVALLADDDVRAGRYHTNFLEAWMPRWRDAATATATAQQHAADNADAVRVGEAM